MAWRSWVEMPMSIAGPLPPAAGEAEGTRLPARPPDLPLSDGVAADSAGTAAADGLPGFSGLPVFPPLADLALVDVFLDMVELRSGGFGDNTAMHDEYANGGRACKGADGV